MNTKEIKNHLIWATATAMMLLSGCGNDTAVDKPKSNDSAVSMTKPDDTAVNKPKSADEVFDSKYLKGVRTVTKVPSLEMEVYRKAAKKALAQLEAGGAVEAAKAQGISQDDYKKMAVEGLVKDLQGNMRSIRDLGETQQKVALQSAINNFL